ncbi:MAG TPA: hypothetical protein ENJ50_05565, partial [Planctomycetaceae bacterium]|nr:hypothetical protein [Planctomycetaceae bacterium]
RKGKEVGPEVNQIANAFPYAFIGAGDVRIAGGDGTIAAFRVKDGKRIWLASVDGRAWSLAVAGDRLFVSTDTGQISCFRHHAENSEPAEVLRTTPVAGHEDDPQRYRQAAKWILDHSGVRRGYCLVLNSGNGHLACSLARQSKLQIIAVESDPALVAASRKRIDEYGLYGTRVSVHHVPDVSVLPYTDYMFNLIVDARIVDGKSVECLDDWRRLQRPYGGVVVTAMKPEGIHRRGPLTGAGDWTHLYANASNTACSNDERVEGPLQLQWFGRPGPQQMVDRHHRTMAPLWKAGRLFIPGDNRVIAVDAYNGALLWNVEVPNMRRVGVYRDCGSMAAASDMLYVASGSRCIGLDVETGRQQQEFFAADPDADQARDWGYVAVEGDWLFGSATRPGASRRGHSLDAIRDGLYWDAHPLVCSLELFLIQRKTGRRIWTYRPMAGAMVNSTFTLGDGKIYFIESDNPATLEQPTGRSTLQDLLKLGCRLVALDCRDGSIAWSRSLALGNVQHV